MQPDNQNQYDFIINQGNNNNPGFETRKRQVIIGAIIALVLIILMAILMSLSSGGGNNDRLVSLQAHQTEINRVITLGQKNINDPAIQQQLGTLQSSLASDQQQLSLLLAKRGSTPSKLQLSKQKDTDVDASLSEALKSGTHDEILQESVKTLVNNYYTVLKEAKDEATSNTEKSILDTSIQNIESIYTN